MALIDNDGNVYESDFDFINFCVKDSIRVSAAEARDIALPTSKEGDYYFAVKSDTKITLYGEQFDYTRKDFEGKYFVSQHGDITLEVKKGSLVKVSSSEFDASVSVYEPGKKLLYDKEGEIVPTKQTNGKYLFDFANIDKVTANLNELTACDDLQMLSKEDFIRRLKALKPQERGYKPDKVQGDRIDNAPKRDKRATDQPDSPRQKPRNQKRRGAHR